MLGGVWNIPTRPNSLHLLKRKSCHHLISLIVRYVFPVIISDKWRGVFLAIWARGTLQFSLYFSQFLSFVMFSGLFHCYVGVYILTVICILFVSRPSPPIAFPPVSCSSLLLCSSVPRVLVSIYIYLCVLACLYGCSDAPNTRRCSHRTHSECSVEPCVFQDSD